MIVTINKKTLERLVDQQLSQVTVALYGKPSGAGKLRYKVAAVFLRIGYKLLGIEFKEKA